MHAPAECETPPALRTLQDALRGLDYPAPRSKLILKAVENRAAPEIIDRLRALPETADFHDEEELRQALGVSVPGEQPRRGWE